MELSQEGLRRQVAFHEKQKLWFCDFQSSNRLLLSDALFRWIGEGDWKTEEVPFPFHVL